MEFDSLLSIRALAPMEQGGPVAREGFIYQDHVAAHYCLRLLGEAGLCEVRCEAEDDITLIWAAPEGECVELIQASSGIGCRAGSGRGRGAPR